MDMTNNSRRLKGTVAIITGGGSGSGSGISEATVRKYVAEGASCVVAHVKFDGAERVVASVERGRAVALRVGASRYDNVQKAVDTTFKHR
jgi:NAD(P)-dependent dehydrogenase (short-subunit alcohol dehydrogenase family)